MIAARRALIKTRRLHGGLRAYCKVGFAPLRERVLAVPRASSIVATALAAPPRKAPMSATLVVLWFVNILLDTVGQLSFKAAAAQPDLGEGLARWRAMARRPWIWSGVGCYVGEFLAWLAFLSLLPLSQGVLLGSINIVVVMVAGRIFFNEKLSPLRTVGILLIAAGVAVVGFGVEA